MTKDNKAIKQTLIRENNVSIISELLLSKPYSCLELSDEINISDVGVNKIIKQLLTLNMVKRVDVDSAEKKVGGQHIRYTLNPNVGLYVCCDFTENVDTAYLYDFSLKLIDKVKFNASYRITEEEILVAIKSIKSMVDKHLNDYNNNLLGIGVSVPGQIDSNTNEFIESGKFMYIKKDFLYKNFTKNFDTYIFIKNNVHLMTLGESYKGKLVGESNIATYVYVGVGLAACVLFNGEEITGWNGYAGEIGGNKVYPASTLSRNCSLGRIFAKVKETHPDIEYGQVFNLYKTDNEFHSFINESARILAMFMNNVTNLLGCDFFMVAGDVLRFGDEYLNIVKEYLDLHAPIKVDVVKYSLDNASIIGILKLLKEHCVIDCYKKKLLSVNN